MLHSEYQKNHLNMRELTLDPEGQPECLNAGMAGRGYPDQRGEHACAPEIRPLDPYWDHFEIMLGSLLKSFQKLPKHSRNYRHLPETTDTFQKLQTHSRNNRNIPETTKTFQKLPAHSRNYRNIPETIETFQKETETFQKLPTHSRNWGLLTGIDFASRFPPSSLGGTGLQSYGGGNRGWCQNSPLCL